MLEHIFPDFDEILKSAFGVSPNVMLFLPRNTSIPDLIKRIKWFGKNVCGRDELLVEIE